MPARDTPHDTEALPPRPDGLSSAAIADLAAAAWRSVALSIATRGSVLPPWYVLQNAAGERLTVTYSRAGTVKEPNCAVEAEAPLWRGARA